MRSISRSTVNSVRHLVNSFTSISSLFKASTSTCAIVNLFNDDNGNDDNDDDDIKYW